MLQSTSQNTMLQSRWCISAYCYYYYYEDGAVSALPLPEAHTISHHNIQSRLTTEHYSLHWRWQLRAIAVVANRRWRQQQRGRLQQQWRQRRRQQLPQLHSLIHRSINRQQQQHHDCLIRPPCQLPQTAKPHATLAGKHGGSYCECGNCPQLSMATAHDQPWTYRSSHDCTINASSGSNYRTRNTNPLVASQRRGGLCKHRRASRCNSSGGSSCGSRIWGKSNHLAGLAKVA